MKILAIETSCDETAVALIEATGDLNYPKFKVLNKVVHSQIEEHKEFGGVYPSLAKREHARNIVPVLSQCLKLKEGKNVLYKENEIKEILKREPDLFEATKKFLENNSKPEIDLIAVTSGPGLEPALWVGINFAKALSLEWQIPLIPVNHMEGHMSSVLLNTNQKIQFPALSLLISGGHTELVEIKKWNEYKILGKTRDDAVGESYDKVARILGFPYPGGPKISDLAQKFRKKEQKSIGIKFPRPMINSKDLDFSFSGLKTAVLYKTQELKKINDFKEEIAYEFEEAIVDVLLNKINKALKENDFKTLIVAGGVTANKHIKERILKISENKDLEILFPEKEDSTDNAQMIAVAGYLKSLIFEPKINPEIKAEGGLTY